MEGTSGRLRQTNGIPLLIYPNTESDYMTVKSEDLFPLQPVPDPIQPKSFSEWYGNGEFGCKEK